MSRIQSVHHVLSDCTLLQPLYKLLYDFKVYIRLQKCHLHFFQCRLDIVFRQTTFASKILKYVSEVLSDKLSNAIVNPAPSRS